MRIAPILIVLLLAGSTAFPAPQQKKVKSPLTSAIDSTASGFMGAAKASPVAEDGEFLRRVMLDLVGYPPTLEEVKAEKLRGGVPNISWTTEYAQLVKDLPNCYAEIGTTWASSVVTFPTVAAHIMGQLMKFMGEDRIVFGSDSVWYGSPQWQIEALWRFQIPEALREKYGYPCAHRVRQAKNPRADLGEIVWRPCCGPGFVPGCPERLRIEDDQRAEDPSRV